MRARTRAKRNPDREGGHSVGPFGGFCDETAPESCSMTTWMADWLTPVEAAPGTSAVVEDDGDGEGAGVTGAATWNQ